MGIKIGTTGIGAIMIGAAAMAKVYIGSTLVWSTGVPPVPPTPQYFTEFYVGKTITKALDNNYEEFSVLQDIVEKV